MESAAERTLVESCNQQILFAHNLLMRKQGECCTADEFETLSTNTREEGRPENKSPPAGTIYDQACKYNCLNSQEHFKYSGKSILKQEGVHN